MLTAAKPPCTVIYIIYVYEKVKEVCQIDCEIKRTENGKPYFEGDPVFFSVSHTGETALIAVCDRAVGVDAEIIKQRDFNAILKRFTAREQVEIALYKDARRNACGGSEKT